MSILSVMVTFEFKHANYFQVCIQHMHDSMLIVARLGFSAACASRGCAQRLVQRFGLCLLLQGSVMGVLNLSSLIL